MKSELINVRPDARKESNGCNGTLEREQWRDVVGYEGLYQVSSFGRVRNPRRNKLMTIRHDKDGYETVGLTNNRVMKTRKVHRLVADAFVPNPNNLPQVNHRNEDKTCNYPDNLEHCSAKYNTRYNGLPAKRGLKLRGIKRSPETCQKYRERMRYAMIPVIQLDLSGDYIKEWDSVNGAAKALGLFATNISVCCRGKIATSGGFKWKYKSDYENEQG